MSTINYRRTTRIIKYYYTEDMTLTKRNGWGYIMFENSYQSDKRVHRMMKLSQLVSACTEYVAKSAD